MIPDSLAPLANHLWQSTVFAVIAGLLTLTLRNNSARMRHWVWVAASVKFLVPFALLVMLGSQVHWRTSSTPAIVPVALGQMSQPFNATASSVPSLGTPSEHSDLLLKMVWVIWAGGFVGFAGAWWMRWRRISEAVRSGVPLSLGLSIPAISSPSFIEPGVFGLLRPVLLLPEGIFDHLTPKQWQSIVAHELCHVRHRDNVVGACQMLVETIFWFHPLVWWVGSRIVHERERACDEEVVRSGSEPKTYAEGILKVCELYLASPLACLPGVSGSNLKNRIRDIMKKRTITELTFTKKAMLAIAVMSVVAVPTAAGIIVSPAVVPQSSPSDPHPTGLPRFDVASLKPSGTPPPGPQRFNVLQGGPGTQDPERITGLRVTLQRLITVAYGVDFDQIQGPPWTGEDRYELAAKVPPATSRDQVKLMLQDLLAERFKLVLHHASKNLPVYELRIAPAGPKFTETLRADLRPSQLNDPAMPLDQNGFPQLPQGVYGSTYRIVNGITRMTFRGMPLSSLAGQLAVQFGTGGSNNTFAMAHVVDKTGLTGKYDFNLEFAGGFGPGAGLSLSAAADAEPSGGLPIETALDKQLGLKLIKSTAPFDILIIDRAERVPTPN